MRDLKNDLAKNGKMFERDIVQSFQENSFPIFAKYISIGTKESNSVFLQWKNWFPGQQKFELNRTKHDVVLKPRQIGFTRLELVRDLFFALKNPKSTVMILQHNEKLALANMQLIKEIYSSLAKIARNYYSDFFPNFRKNSVENDMKTQKTMLQFSNGSKIYSYTAGGSEQSSFNAGRGLTIHRLHATEVGFWPYAETTLDSVMKAVPKNNFAEVVFESTPKGAGNIFHSLCQKSIEGKNDYAFHFLEWWHHPEMRMEAPKQKKREFLYYNYKPNSEVDVPRYKKDVEVEKEIEFVPRNETENKLKNEMKLPVENLWYFRREWDNETSANVKSSMLMNYPLDPFSCFIADSESALLDDEKDFLADKIKDPIEFEKIFDLDLRIWEQPIENEQYIVGADVSGGSGNDYSTSIVLNMKTGQIAAILESTNVVLPTDFASFLVEIATKYNNAMISCENNSIGVGTINGLKQLKYKNLFYHKTEKKKQKKQARLAGFSTQGKNKPMLTSFIRGFIKDLEWFDGQLFSQLISCKITEAGSLEAIGKKENRKNCHDDLVMAWGIALASRAETLSKSMTANLGKITIGNSKARGVFVQPQSFRF